MENIRKKSELSFMAPRDETEFHTEMLAPEESEKITVYDPENSEAWITTDMTMETVDTTAFRDWEWLVE